jgi:glycosyltransferase involved in cell wall biosynthesis
MTRNSLRIGVVIPAYRVEKELAGVLSRVPATVDSVFVVDDASPDSIRSAVESVADPRIVLLRHETNQGVGGAMVTGFRAALAASDRVSQPG